MEENKEEEIKVILLGNTGVGKTNLINIATGNKFNEDEKATAAASYSVIKIEIDNKYYNINLWDTIGQERYRQLTKIFFNNSKIVIFVYDITKPESFEALKDWKKDVEDQIGTGFVKGVVANKNDLYLEEKVKQEDGENYADSINATFLTFSAKIGNPKKFEEYLIKLVREFILTKKENNEDRFTLSTEYSSKANKNRKCCN